MDGTPPPEKNGIDAYIKAQDGVINRCDDIYLGYLSRIACYCHKQEHCLCWMDNGC